MAKKRLAKKAPIEGPVALSVTEMAVRCRLSRSRFHALVKLGVFPEPRREAGRRPYYSAALIEQCLEVRRTGVGVNGEVVMFNRRIRGR
jgi:hypothetical protein